MRKITIQILILLSLNLSANSVDDGMKAYRDGNATKASHYFKEACKKKNMQGCVKLGILYFTGDGVTKNPKKSKKLFIKACKAMYPHGCYHLGVLYMRGADGIERNFKKARFYYAHGCRLRYEKSCVQYNRIREKREIVGNGNNDHNFSYTYTTEIYGG